MPAPGRGWLLDGLLGIYPLFTDQRPTYQQSRLIGNRTGSVHVGCDRAPCAICRRNSAESMEEIGPCQPITICYAELDPENTA